MGNISVFISAGGDKRIVEEVQGCVYAGMFLDNNGKIKIRPMCMRGIPTTIAMDYFFREMKKRVQEYSKEEIQ